MIKQHGRPQLKCPSKLDDGSQPWLAAGAFEQRNLGAVQAARRAERLLRQAGDQPSSSEVPQRLGSSPWSTDGAVGEGDVDADVARWAEVVVAATASRQLLGSGPGRAECADAVQPSEVPVDDAAEPQAGP